MRNDPAKPATDLLTLDAAAARLGGVSVKTVEREIAAGRLAVTRIGARRYLTAGEIDLYLERQTSSATYQIAASARRVSNRNRLSSESLASQDEIVAAARTYQPAIGIYFLLCGDRIVYVGQSTNVHRRIAQHREDGRLFDRWHFIRCKEEILCDLERRYILALNPEMNINVPQGGSPSDSELAAAVSDLPTLQPTDAPDAR